jgi:hypothetical protein
MRCPLDEKVLIDYLEGELEGQPAAELSEHVASCTNCSREISRLRSIRWAVRDKAAACHPPDEDFWRSNLEAVGRATWQSGKPGRAFSFRKLNKFIPVVAAAAVILLALMGTFNMDRTTPAGYAGADSDSISAKAMVDTLYMLAELARQYEMTYSTMESIEELAGNDSTESYSESGLTYPVTSNVYDALLDMDDDQLDQVFMVLASN